MAAAGHAYGMARAAPGIIKFRKLFSARSYYKVVCINLLFYKL